jgi:pectate lyase
MKSKRSEVINGKRIAVVVAPGVLLALGIAAAPANAGPRCVLVSQRAGGSITADLQYSPGHVTCLRPVRRGSTSPTSTALPGSGTTSAPVPAPAVTLGAGGSGAAATDLVGWATQNGGTTGGGSGTVVEVSTADAFLAAVQSDTAQTVRLTGSISLSGMNKVASDKTVIGAGGNARITGGGLNVAKAKNVVIRNISFSGWDDDAINVQESTNVWIDHNSFSDGYDGAVDIKRASDFVTVSWNRFANHDKTCLLGHSDDNGDQDRGHLRVTYHHNWFDGTGQRHPRVRFANPVHVYNNYYANVDGYGVASTEGAGVLVESNYFENVEDPFHLGEADSGPGSLVARNNHLVNSGAGETGGTVASIPYAYTADAAESVKSLVSSGAGAGHL